MIILWKADYEGEELEKDLKRLDQLQKEIQERIGGKVDGPYFPQDASVLYIFHVGKYEWLNQAGRIYFSQVARENLAFIPKTYEIAVTPDEFFGEE